MDEVLLTWYMMFEDDICGVGLVGKEAQTITLDDKIVERNIFFLHLRSIIKML